MNEHNAEETSLSKLSMPVPRNAKIFSINKLEFTSFDMLLHESSEQLGIEFELFFCNNLGTQWGYMRVVDGKVKKTIPLLELNVLSVTPVNPKGLCADGYIVRYCLSTMIYEAEKYIPYEFLRKNGLIEFFSLPPPCSKKTAELCDLLIRQIILQKASESKGGDYIEIGDRQGWRKRSNRRMTFEAKDNYPIVLHPVLPPSILHRERASCAQSPSPDQEKAFCMIVDYMRESPQRKIMLLLRFSSYHASIAYQYGLSLGIVPILIPDDMISAKNAAAMVRNDHYRTNEMLTLGGNVKACQEKISECNDGTLVVIDDTKIDEQSKRAPCLRLLESQLISGESKNHFVPIIISPIAAPEITPQLGCPLTLGNIECGVDPILLNRILFWRDAQFLATIENDYDNYASHFRQIITEVAASVPAGIPSQKRSAFIFLIAAARLHDMFFTHFFGDNTERFIAGWLSGKYGRMQMPDERILTLFGITLNTEIASGRFRFIRREKYIVFDKGQDMVIVDDDCIYIETNVIKTLAEDKMDLCSVNALTDVMKETEVLAINDRNSKCYRFHVQSSFGTPYLLYTYGISKNLITAENRKMLDLADKSDYFLDSSDFDSRTIQPLGMISAGCYIGKDITFGSKSNNHVFVTGQIGNGKTFCVTNLLPSIAMLGGNAIVIDVSNSFTEDEVLRALPQRIVDTMFAFVDVGKGGKKLPVNPLYIGDCVGLPAKKRRIVGFVKTAAGKLNTEDARLVAGLISEQLKGHDEITAFTPDMLRSTLKEGGKAGHNALSLISSVLDDLEAIGYEEQGWDEFFSHSKRIPVILLSDADGANVHPLVDTLLQSAFEWQRDHATAPLTVTIDEVKDQSFSDGSPLHTIMTQGRKFGIRLIGITQDFVSNSSHSIDVMKQAGIKILFKPAKSRDRIAAELGYRNAVDAGFSSMRIGEFIVSCDLYNKEDGVNEPVVIPAKTVRFTESPLYDRFCKEFGLN